MQTHSRSGHEDSRDYKSPSLFKSSTVRRVKIPGVSRPTELVARTALLRRPTPRRPDQTYLAVGALIVCTLKGLTFRCPIDGINFIGHSENALILNGFELFSVRIALLPKRGLYSQCVGFSGGSLPKIGGELDQSRLAPVLMYIRQAVSKHHTNARP